MTQKNKELLLKDLCARLSYGVKCQIQEGEHIHIGTLCRIEIDKKNGHLLDFVESINYSDCQFYISEVKPYLFPLSSMTEEQKIIYGDLCYQIINATPFEIQNCFNELYNWLIKNNFDYQGLIPMGLAINATGLGVY